VTNFLKRWWYAVPHWPPKDYDIVSKLKELKLRKVNIQEWRLEPNVDENGYSKCVELEGFPLVFLDYQSKVHDLRPKDTMPSFNNYIKKVLIINLIT
jgi:hypothetical protein